MNTEEIKNNFLNNEKILWQGAPKKVPLYNKYDILMIPFTIIFGSMFISYAIVSAIMMFAGQSIMFSFIGITLLLIGLYIVFFRLWYRKKRISREIYFVTENRVFSFDTMRDNVLFDIPLDETELYLGDKSLILSATNSVGDFVYNLGFDIFFRKFARETPSFKYIDDLDSVAKIITQNKEKAVNDDDDSVFI